MTEGQEKKFNDSAYYYSDDTDVVYFDYRTNTLVANNDGTAHVYVYTKGGIPYFKLTVYVSAKTTSSKTAATLNVVPEKWHLDIGDEIGFEVYSSDGKKYDDIVLEVWSGQTKGYINAVAPQKLTAEKAGAIVVRAYSKSNPAVNGNALVYVGEFINPIYDKFIKSTDDYFTIPSWYSRFDDYYLAHSYYDYMSAIKGWIKNTEGILIPVLKAETAEVVSADGKTTTTIIKPDSVPYTDYIFGKYDGTIGLLPERLWKK